MRRAGPRHELRVLKRFVSELESEFLEAHLASSSLTPSRREVLDAAACAVLAHGALENFIEGVSLWALDRVESSWVMNQRATRCTASFMLYAASLDDEKAGYPSVYDNLRRSIAEAKKAMSRTIEGNNGITPRHLRTLLIPLGIDVPDDPVLVGALDQLIAIRHEWAHQYRFGAKKLKSAKDVQTTVGDCVSLAEQLVDGAARLRP